MTSKTLNFSIVCCLISVSLCISSVSLAVDFKPYSTEARYITGDYFHFFLYLLRLAL